LLAPLRTGPETQKAYDLLRGASKMVEADRSLSRDIEAVAARIAAGDFSGILR
jgi:histidine ammonia-lyase